MKLQFRACQIAPEYSTEGADLLGITFKGIFEKHDFSDLKYEEEFIELDTAIDTKSLILVHHAERKENGELHLVLNQKTPKYMLTLIFVSQRSITIPIYEGQDLSGYKSGQSYKLHGNSEVIRTFHFRPTPHWIESRWIDSDNYDPNKLYIREK